MVDFHRKQVKTSHRSLTIILARFAILPPGVICVRNLRNVIIIEDAIDAGFLCPFGERA